eukprot:8830815-Pyramimonas_sp.AAC.1
MGDANMGRWMVERILRGIGLAVVDAAGHHFLKTELPATRESKITDQWMWDSNGIWLGGVAALQEVRRSSSRARSIMQTSWTVRDGKTSLGFGFVEQSYRGHPANHGQSALVGPEMVAGKHELFKDVMALLIMKRESRKVPGGEDVVA